MFELTVPPASNVAPQHSHTDNEEIVYVLKARFATPLAPIGEISRPARPCRRQREPFTASPTPLAASLAHCSVFALRAELVLLLGIVLFASLMARGVRP